MRRRLVGAGLVVGLVAGVVLVSLARAEPRAGAAASGRPPVVVILFDEFSTTSLLDRRGRVDAARYPSFASLAAEATWFPNDTASVDETGRAVEAILTGGTPRRHNPATPAANPRSLFTLLGGRYRIRSSEEVTSICPARLCPGIRPQTRDSVLHELAGGRPERFQAWVRSIGGGRGPVLYFKHVLLPHVPFRYLPSGRHYRSGPHEVIPGMVDDFSNRWLIQQAYQRHLLQVGFTDRLLGAALERLRQTGLYDRSLVVVTADNGESFGRVGNRHEISSRNAEGIALTPLFVKVPGQRRSRVVRRHVRTVDILPTIAHVLRMRLPWRTEGVSALGPAARRIPGRVRMLERSGRQVLLSFRAFQRRARAALRRKLRLFGSGSGPPGLYGIGPHPRLVGRPLSTLPVSPARGVRAALNGAGAFRDVRLRSSFVPSQITGRILGRGRKRLHLAIAVDGLIAATAPTFHVRGAPAASFSAMVPESAFREGRNELEVLAIVGGGSGLRLRSLARAPM